MIASETINWILKTIYRYLSSIRRAAGLKRKCRRNTRAVTTRRVSHPAGAPVPNEGYFNGPCLPSPSFLPIGSRCCTCKRHRRRCRAGSGLPCPSTPSTVSRAGADVVYISLVRSNGKSEIGFPQRLPPHERSDDPRPQKLVVVGIARLLAMMVLQAF